MRNPKENNLLIDLLDEYKNLLIRERDFRESEVRKNYSEAVDNREERQNRPTKTYLNRIGLLIRHKSIEAEKDFDRNYWG